MHHTPSLPEGPEALALPPQGAVGCLQEACLCFLQCSHPTREAKQRGNPACLEQNVSRKHSAFTAGDVAFWEGAACHHREFKRKKKKKKCARNGKLQSFGVFEKGKIIL